MPSRLRSSILYRSRKPLAKQVSLAAFLPPEVLIAILGHLHHQPRDRLDSYPPTSHPHERALSAAPLVCKSWTLAASAVLYEHVRLFSATQLSKFLVSLHTPRSRSESRRLLVHSVAFQSSLMGLSGESDARHANLAEAEMLLVVMLCLVLPNASEVRLRLKHPSSPKTISQNPIAAEKLTTLCISGYPGIIGPIMEPGLKFPALEDITFEYAFINAAICWPEMPVLRALRMYRCYINRGDYAPSVHKIKNLRELEMVEMVSDPGAMTVILHSLSSTLEVLTVIGVHPSFIVLSDLYILKTLTSLRRLCVGPSLSLVLGSTRTLPPSLRQLTIWELSSTQYRSTLRSSTAYNVEDLLMLLCLEVDVCLPELEEIRVRGEESQWTGWKDYFTKRCEEIGVQFHLEVFDDPESRGIRVLPRKTKRLSMGKALRRLT